VVDKENDSLNRLNLFKVANRYYNIKQLERNLIKPSNLVLSNSEKVRTLNIIKAYTYLGDYYDSQSIMDSSFQFYYKAERCMMLGDNLNLGRILINKSKFAV
jgi:hypothetical protein